MPPKDSRAETIRLDPQGPYSLSASARFLEGFTPAAHERADEEGHLHLAFCVEGADTVANHTGARGLAEPPIIPTAPAIANAVANAIGADVDELPLTPWRVLAALGR